jgi:hypothetical protein
MRNMDLEVPTGAQNRTQETLQMILVAKEGKIIRVAVEGWVEAEGVVEEVDSKVLVAVAVVLRVANHNRFSNTHSTK